MANSNNSNLQADNQQLAATEQQLRASNQQLAASNQQLLASEQQLRAANQQLKAEEQQLKALNQQLLADEKALQQSRARYKSMFDYTMNGVAVYEGVNDGESFVFREFNPAAEQIENCRKEDILGKDVQEVFPGVVEMGLLDVFRRVWKTGKDEMYPAVQYKDGRIEGWRENHVFKLPSGELVAVYKDLTELKRTEKELRESKNKILALLEGSPVSNKIIDLDSRLRYMSAAGLKHLKITDIEPYYGEIYPPQFYPESMRAPLIEHLERAKKGEITSIEGPVLDMEGGKVWYHTTFVPARGDDGRIEYVIASSVEVTDRVRAEQLIKNNQNRLRSMAARLSSAEERERRHIAEGIHDSIIQPLIFLDIKIKSLLNDAVDSEMRDSFEQMRKMLAGLIEKSRTFTFDLSNPILYELGLKSAIEEWLRTEITEKSEIAVELEVKTQTKDMDQSLVAFLFKSVRELLINVVKHAKAENIKVSVVRESGNIVVCVKDDGCGFAPASDGIDEDKKSGFGLYNIREQLACLGGEIKIDSKPGSGSEVTLTVSAESKL